MKLKVYEKNEENKIRYLRLMEIFDEVSLVVVDENGERVDYGNILVIKDNGTIYLNRDINPALGFQLDDNGRMRMYDGRNKD